jgi:hypothetical protein
MKTPQYFDYLKIARDANLSDSEIASLEQAVERDVPHDLMMSELRLLRTLTAIRDGFVTVKQAVAELGGPSATAA